jgi:hypothetical protein
MQRQCCLYYYNWVISRDLLTNHNQKSKRPKILLAVACHDATNNVGLQQTVRQPNLTKLQTYSINAFACLFSLTLSQSNCLLADWVRSLVVMLHCTRVWWISGCIICRCHGVFRVDGKVYYPDSSFLAMFQKDQFSSLFCPCYSQLTWSNWESYLWADDML